MIITRNSINSDPVFHPFQYFSLISLPIQFLAYLRLINLEPLALGWEGWSDVVFVQDKDFFKVCGLSSTSPQINSEGGSCRWTTVAALT